MTDMTTRRKRLSTVALLLGATLFIGACGGEPADSGPTETPTLEMRYETAGDIPVHAARMYSGSVEGARRVPLSTRVMGRVVHLAVDEGDDVREGDILVRIDDGQLTAQRSQAEAGLREARAHLENARTNFTRFETLLGQGSATEREYDDAKTALESTEARVQSLENRIAEIEDALDYTVIRAPVSGILARKHVEQGAMAAPGAPLVTVETLDALEVALSVPESDVNLLSAGQEVRIHIDATGRTTAGVIEEINRAATGPGRSYTVRVLFKAESAGARPGMFARISVPMGESGRTIAVPEEAIVHRGQLTGVYALTADDRVVLRWVRPGRSLDGRVEILSGLAEGERYVIPDGERLEDGQLVNVMNRVADTR